MSRLAGIAAAACLAAGLVLASREAMAQSGKPAVKPTGAQARAPESQGAAPGSFLAAWQLEVISGDWKRAARAYQDILDSSLAPPRDRERAAYRAGRCNELLGQPQLARLAYEWLVARADADPALRDAARARLVWLRRPAGFALAGDAGAAAEPRRWRSTREALAAVEAPSLRLAAAASASEAPDPAVIDVLRELENGARARVDIAHRLAAGLDEVSSRKEALARVIERLRRRGVDVAFRAAALDESSAPAATADPFVAGIADRLRVLLGAGDDLDRLRAYLADRWCAEALRDAAVGAPVSRRGSSLALALRPDHAAARDFLVLLADVESRDALASLARRRLDRGEEEAIAAARQQLALHLGRSLQPERPDRAFREIEAARVVVAWTPRHALLDPEVAALAERARKLYVDAAGVAFARILESHWDFELALARLLQDGAESWVEAAVELSERESESFDGGTETSLEALRKVLREIEIESSAAQSGTDGQRGAAALLRAHELDLLGRWFPAGRAALDGISPPQAEPRARDDTARRR